MNNWQWISSKEIWSHERLQALPGGTKCLIMTRSRWQSCLPPSLNKRVKSTDDNPTHGSLHIGHTTISGGHTNADDRHTHSLPTPKLNQQAQDPPSCSGEAQLAVSDAANSVQIKLCGDEGSGDPTDEGAGAGGRSMKGGGGEPAGGRRRPERARGRRRWWRRLRAASRRR